MLKNKITTVVLENSEKELNKIVEVLKELPEIMVIGEASSGEKGLPLIYNNLPTLVFINRHLADMSGFELAKILRNKNSNHEIVFLANDRELAFDALPYRPFDFYVKPVRKEQIKEMLERFKIKAKKQMLIDKIESLSRSFNKETKRIFYFKNGIIVVSLDEIIYCRTHGAKTNLVLKDGNEIILSSGMNETIEIINNNRFMKCSRAYWINSNFLRKIDKRRHKCIVYNDGKSWEIPVSRSSEKMLESLLIYPVS